MRRQDPLPWVVGVCATLVYLAWPSCFYNFDGVACAIAVDLGDLAHLVHGNHLLYGLAGLGFFKLWQAAGYAGPSLPALQTLDALLGGAGAGVFCALLLRLRFPRGLAAAAAAGLALSQAYWFWSLEAQVYLLGAFFAVLAFFFACADEPQAALAGACHGLAVLGHVGHVLLAAPLLVLLASGGRLRRDLPRYLAAAAAVVLAGYALGAACVHPRSLSDLRIWLLGSAALSVSHKVRWYGGYSWSDLRDWLRMTPRLFADFDSQPAGPRALAFLLDGAALALCAAGLERGLRDGRRRAAAAALAWLAAYAVLYTSWQPYTVVYRISDLPALWLLAAFGLGALGAAAVPAAAGAAAALGLFNFAFMIAPHARPESNSALQETLYVARETPPSAWVVVTALDQVYMPYFGHRRPLNTRYFEGRPAALTARLDALAAAGEPVYVTEDTLRKGAEYGWDAPLRAYGLRPVADGPTRLYRLARPRREAPR